MRCADVMTTDVVFARTDDTVAAVSRVMQKRGVTFLQVCDAAGSVVGFVTDQHITRVVVEDDVGPSASVESVMGRDVSICSPDDDVAVAERALAAHPGRCAVCVGPAGNPIGVVGVTDLARAATR